MSFPNPSIAAEVTRKALVPDDPNAKNERQSALDVAELREFERAEHYPKALAVSDATGSAATQRRSLLDRLFRRTR